VADSGGHKIASGLTRGYSDGRVSRPASPRLKPHMSVTKKSTAQLNVSEKGKLRIGDDWNAIRIIALSQGNPLKAIAELTGAKLAIASVGPGREQTILL